MPRIYWKSKRNRTRTMEHGKPISMAEYCKSHHLTDSGVRYQISQGRIDAFKRGGRWWVQSNAVLDLSSKRGKP